jgi:hypothetical protein
MVLIQKIGKSVLNFKNLSRVSLTNRLYKYNGLTFLLQIKGMKIRIFPANPEFSQSTSQPTDGLKQRVWETAKINRLRPLQGSKSCD